MNWFTPLYLLAIFGIVRYFLPPKEEPKKGKINWSWLESIGVTLAIYFVAQFLGSLLIYIFPLLRGWSGTQISDWASNSVWGQFLLLASIEFLTVWLLYKFLQRRRATFGTIGLKRRPKWSDLAYVLLGFGVYFLIFVFASTLAKGLFPHLNVDQQQQVGFSGAHGVQLVPVFLSLVIMPPLAEELLVRGFLYSGLKNGIKIVWAVLITSGLFAMAHLQAGSGEPLLWIAAIDTFTLSLVLIYLKEKTGSLWASIGLHMLKNLIAFLSLFVFHII